jgi:hypothetical protein
MEARERGARHGIGEPMIVGNERCRGDRFEVETGGWERGSPTSSLLRMSRSDYTSARRLAVFALIRTMAGKKVKATGLQFKSGGVRRYTNVENVREQA